MLTIAEQWEQQAMERGIERGERDRSKGIEQGEARLLKQLLTWRFGALPAWVESQLAGAEPERLEAWAKRVLDAQTLDAVFVEEGNSRDSIVNSTRGADQTGARYSPVSDLGFGPRFCGRSLGSSCAH
jgi:hypothetical protein